MIMLKYFHSKVNYSNWWLKKLQAQSVGSPLPPHSLIFEKFEKSMAVPDMTPELVIGHTVFLYVL